MVDRTDDNGAAYAGSQLQTQMYVNRRREQLNDAIRAEFSELEAAAIDWRSPLAPENYREYWDRGFLDCLDLGHHAADLKGFWPTGGPHWDALAVVRFEGGIRRGAILGEGKSYPKELYGGGCAAQPGSISRQLIEESLSWTQQRLGVHGKTSADWCGPLYQHGNRLAHLHWLRSRGVRTWLVHLLFTDDLHGPTTRGEWTTALKLADEELGLTGLRLEHAGHVFLPAGTREELLD